MGKRKRDTVLPKGFLDQLELERQSALGGGRAGPAGEGGGGKGKRAEGAGSGKPAKDAQAVSRQKPHQQGEGGGEGQGEGGGEEQGEHVGHKEKDAPAARPSALSRLAGILKVNSFYGAARNNATIHKLQTKTMRMSRATVAQEFGRQQLAFDFADSVRGEEVHTFSRETDSTGKRRFLVTSYGELYRRVSIAKAHQQSHFYEIIREGSACALYFDVEFSKTLNPGRDGDEALAVFLEYLPTAIGILLPGKGLAMRREDVVDMDSSTARKFSRHLIIRLNGGSAVFQNNANMGAFVCRLATHISAERAQRPDLDKCFAIDSSGNSTIFLDLGVYTKNRCFRTAFSSKFGKPAARLVPSNSNTSPYDVGEDEAFFYRSLVCRIPSSVDRETITIITDPSMVATVMSKVDANGESVAVGKGEFTYQRVESSWPLVDRFILQVWNERAGTQNGRIRSIVCLSGSDLLVYSLSGNRWCETVGRQHKSNGVMLLVDKAKGCFYQKCYDPDCRSSGARSSDFPLPPEVLPKGWGVGEEQWAEGVNHEAEGGDQSNIGGTPVSQRLVQGSLLDDDDCEGIFAAADQAVLQWEAQQGDQAAGGTGNEEWDDDAVFTVADRAVLEWEANRSGAKLAA